jgi:hypothetical protein
MLADLAGSSACDILGRESHVRHPDHQRGALCRLGLSHASNTSKPAVARKSYPTPKRKTGGFGYFTAARRCDNIGVLRPEQETTGTTGQPEVEWEEAFLIAWGAEIPIPPGGLLSAQCGSSPPGRGRRDNPSHEGKAARGC